MKRSIFQIVGLLLLLPLFSGCNDSDDLQGIFTGKTWKLTYINLKDKGGWMNGFSEKSIKILNENQESYTITFTGTEEDNRISNGAVKGRIITADLTGTWSATLHYTPIAVSKEGFITICLLLKGTGDILEKRKKILKKKNKWFIAHQDNLEKIASGDYPGLLGRKIIIDH